MNEIWGVYPQQESKELFDTLASVSDFNSPVLLQQLYHHVLVISSKVCPPLKPCLKDILKMLYEL